MASFADLRPIIVICCVVGFFLVFLGWVSAETPTFLTGNIPSETERALPKSVIAYLNGTFIYINHVHGWTSTGTINNGSLSIKIYNNNDTDGTHHYIQVDTFDTVTFGIQINFESFTWYTNSSKLEVISTQYTPAGEAWATWPGISISTLDTMYEANGNISCYIANSRAAANVQFAFNNASYDSPSDAWVHNALAISFDAGYQESRSASNAFDYILSALTWGQLGATTNFPIWLYALVDLAFLAPAIYVIGIWILRLLGSIAGGGGSG